MTLGSLLSNSKSGVTTVPEFDVYYFPPEPPGDSPLALSIPLIVT